MYEDYDDWKKMARPANENPELKGTEFYDTLYRDLDIPAETATDRFIPQFIMDQGKGRKTQTYQYNYTRATNTEHHIRYDQTISGLRTARGTRKSEPDRQYRHHLRQRSWSTNG